MLRFSENIRGEEIFKKEEAKHLFEQSKPFSVSICDGKGEIFFKRIQGEWHECILSVDKCFGVIRSKWRKLNI